MSRDIVFVTNNNDFYHEDRFDGQVYQFAPKEKIQVPVDAAVHMFGFNMPDKTDALVRLGWAMIYDPESKRMVENPEGVKRLAKFVFTRAVMVEEVIAPGSKARIEKVADSSLA